MRKENDDVDMAEERRKRKRIIPRTLRTSFGLGARASTKSTQRNVETPNSWSRN